MTKTRREFSPEFKREAVALLESSGRPLLHVAAELGIQPSMSRSWRAIQNGVPPCGRAGQASVPAHQGQRCPLQRISRPRTPSFGVSSSARAWSVMFQEKPSASSRRCRSEACLYRASHAAVYPVRLMCRVLEVSPSGYYAWRSRPESTRALASRQLVSEIRRLAVRHHGRHGSPRMHAALRAEGHRCSRARVARLMRAHGIRAVAGRRFRPCTTDSRHDLAVAPNLLAQCFEAPGPNRIWLPDITYIPTAEGWLYLAAILDLATRKVVGWAMRDHLRAKLTQARPHHGRPAAAAR